MINKIKDSDELEIKVHDFNKIAHDTNFIKKLRKLTLSYDSGMNHELDNLENLVKVRKVKCKIITAYLKSKMVGWALLSKEDTDFVFTHSNSTYNKNKGQLFEVYVDPNYRRKGIGSLLVKTAKRRTKSDDICFCPWNVTSEFFYRNFDHYKHKKI